MGKEVAEFKRDFYSAFEKGDDGLDDVVRVSDGLERWRRTNFMNLDYGDLNLVKDIIRDNKFLREVRAVDHRIWLRDRSSGYMQGLANKIFANIDVEEVVGN